MSHPRYNDLDQSLANHGSFGTVDLVARMTDGKYFIKNVVHLCEMVQPLSRDDLYQFVAFSLWDKDAVKKGSLGNDISHPRYVPSGLTPSITRDNGHQLELVNGQKK